MQEKNAVVSELEKLIEQLPKNINEAVVQQLGLIPKLEKGNSELLRTKETLSQEIERLNIESVKLDIQIKDLTALKNREEAVSKREREYRISMLECQLNASKESNGQIFALVSLLVANPRAIEIMEQSHNSWGSADTVDSYGNTKTMPYNKSGTGKATSEMIYTKDSPPKA